ncbi:MAG: hypothetical protein WC326_12615 [Candidatus Delongbacteria bacterium]
MKHGVRGSAVLCPMLLLTFVGGPARAAAPADPDSLRLYFLEPVTVRSPGLAPGQERAPLGGASVEQALRSLGLQPVRRGAALTGDVSAGTFNRGDIDILIDGERHPNACPNRMDNPATRLNPAEMAELELLRSCCAASCGLGGVLDYHRKRPGRALAWDADLQSSALAATEHSLALGLEGAGLRLSVRHLLGAGYRDGEGRDFQDLYPYGGTADYRSSEAAFLTEQGPWSGGLSASLNQDLPFPYLQMDERVTRHLAAHVAWKGWKLYGNHTGHTMDDGLRAVNGVPLAAPTMVSEATNSVVGLTGRWLHVSAFRWSLDNHFNTPAGRLKNHMLPDLRQYSAEAHHNLRLPGPWSLSLRAGLNLDQVGDESAVRSVLGRLRPDPDLSRLFVTHGVALQYGLHAGAWHGALLLESASDDPGLDALWMNLRKPAGKPWWLGNPELDAALRHTLRGRIARGPFECEAAVSRVNGYVSPARAAFATSDSTSQAVQTWRGVAADMLEAQLRYAGAWLDSRASFAWGRDVEAGEALPEMTPLLVESTLRRPLPALAGEVWLRHSWSAAQRRVNTMLNERPTGAWNRLDLGLGATWKSLELALELDNLLDHAYAQHLSYARNPFSAGATVLESGRALQLRVHYRR